MKSNIPKLTHIIPSQGSGRVGAVTSLADDVFVARCNSLQIEVYDSVTFVLKRHLTVPGLGSRVFGLIASLSNSCLCVSDFDHNRIHRVELSGSNAVKEWSVGSKPAGLSMNNAHNLVVACCGANKLQEYTMDGILVREISLQAGVTSPRHAIQLSTGNYVVSQNRSGAVSVVTVDGQVVHSYGQSQTSDVGQMRNPTSLAVTSNDDILVADVMNNRILSIDRSLSRAQELALSVDGGINQPVGLCLDEPTGRLYVCEFSGQCRVLVFDSVKV